MEGIVFFIVRVIIAVLIAQLGKKKENRIWLEPGFVFRFSIDRTYHHLVFKEKGCRFCRCRQK